MGDTIGDVIAVVIFALLVFVMFSIELDPDLLGVRP